MMKVAELQALISSNKSDITSLKDELGKKTTLDEVKAVLADYATKKYVDDADATLKAALDGDIDALKTAVAAAQPRIFDNDTQRQGGDRQLPALSRRRGGDEARKG